MQTRKALKNLSKGKVSYDNVTTNGPLAKNADWLLKLHEKNTANIEASKRRHEFAAATPVLQTARNKIDDVMSNNVLPDDTPICMRFDAYSVIKKASRQNGRDLGLKRLATHLERLWHKDPMGTLSAGAISRIRDHYQYENPRSIIGETVDTLIPEVSFQNLPVAKLVRIAKEISNQEDYDHAIVRYGLHTDNPNSVRARTFIRELVNRKAQINKSDKCGGDKCSNRECPCGSMLGKEKQKLGNISRHANHGGDIARRVASRIYKDVQEAPDNTAESDTTADDDSQIKSKDLGVSGSGMMPTTASKEDEFLKIVLAEQELMLDWAASSGEGIPKIANKEAKAPEGWEKTVKKMKKHEEIESPLALVHWMKGKGYKPGGKKESPNDKKSSITHESDKFKKWVELDKKAQTPHGVGWSVKNLTELARDVVEEMRVDPTLTQITNPIVGPYVGDKRIQKYPQNLQYMAALAMGLHANPRLASRLITSAAKGPSQQEFNPDVKDQQPNQLGLEENQGEQVLTTEKKLKQDRATMKAFAVFANHPLVDDNADHFPIDSQKRADIAKKYANQISTANLIDVPAWWLGSVDELAHVINVALQHRESGKLPPALEKYKKTKGGDGDNDDGGDKKDDNGGMPEDVKEKFKSKKSNCEILNLTANNIEERLISNTSVSAAGYQLVSKGNSVHLASNKGAKKYAIFDMDSAIADFMYLVDTSKHPAGSPPSPVFFVREGLRLTCPGCYEHNSYIMPKQAMDMNCGKCKAIFPIRAISAALDVGAAKEETVLVAIAPIVLQEKYGDIFAKAAQMMDTNKIGVEGCRAEAYGLNIPNEKMAEVWDFMVKSGFKPIAQEIAPAAPAGTAQPPSAPASVAPAGGGGMTAQGPDMPPPSDMPPMPPMEGGPLGEEPMGEPGPDLGEATEGPTWEDHQMVQAAMMHYQHQGMSPVEAIGQFSKDYGDGYDSESVIQMAATVYGINLSEIKVSGPTEPDIDLPPETPEISPLPMGGGLEPMGAEAARQGQRADADKLPSTEVNPQQPDTTKVPSDLGPDSETHGEISAPGKVNPQVPAQKQPGTSQTSGEIKPDSDNVDPGDYDKGSVKPQHPATDQSGASNPPTAGPASGLGHDSETQMGPTMTKMEQESSGAYSNVQSS